MNATASHSRQTKGQIAVSFSAIHHAPLITIQFNTPAAYLFRIIRRFSLVSQGDSCEAMSRLQRTRWVHRICTNIPIDLCPFSLASHFLITCVILQLRVAIF